MNVLNPLLPENSYLVASAIGSTEPFVEVFQDRDPTPNDTNYIVQRRWLNTSTFVEWMLIGFTSFGGLLQGVWVPLGGVTNLRFGVPFGSSPVAGDVNGLLKFTSNDGSVVITGTNGGVGAQSINFATSGTTNAIQQMTLDDGVITPAGSPNNVTIHGATVNNSTNAKPLFFNQVTASTAQIEIQVASQQASGNVNKAGIASFDLADFTVDPTTGFVQLSSSGATGTLTGNGATVATASAGNINVLGTGNITTTGATDILTIALTGTTNHAVQLGNSSGSLTSLTPPTSAYAVLEAQGTNPSTTDPQWISDSNNFNATFGNFNGSYVSQTGRWIRFGNMVFVQINMDWTGNSNLGNITITNLPFNSGSALSHYPAWLTCSGLTLPVGSYQMVADISSNNSTILSVLALVAGGSPTPVKMTASGTLSISIVYFAVGL